MMKKMMILASAVMMALAAKASENAVAPFNGVRVNVPARVRIVYGEEYGVRVQASDAQTQQAVRWAVNEEGVLTFSARSSEEAEQLENVCITVFTPVDQEVRAGRNMEIRASQTPDVGQASK